MVINDKVELLYRLRSRRLAAMLENKNDPSNIAMECCMVIDAHAGGRWRGLCFYLGRWVLLVYFIVFLAFVAGALTALSVQAYFSQ